MKQVNNKYTTIVLGEETLRKLSQLDIQSDDMEQVRIALENIRMEHAIDDQKETIKIPYDFINKRFI